MKESPLHSYPWYQTDWAGSETRMRLTPEGRGIYRDLLDKCWEQGSLPVDERTLAKIADCSLAALRKCWPGFRDKFVERDGRLFNDRVDADRPRLVNWREARRNAGKKGGVGKSKAQAIAIENPKQTPSKTLAIATTEFVANAKPPSSSSSSSSSFHKEATAAARDEPSPGTPDPQQHIAAVVHVIAAMWPLSCSEPASRLAAEREWANSTVPVGEWCQKLSASADRWARYHREQRKKRGHFIPPLPRWLSDGDYSRMPPGEAGAPKPLCGTCGGAGTVCYGITENATLADIDAATKPCPACRSS